RRERASAAQVPCGAASVARAARCAAPGAGIVNGQPLWHGRFGDGPSDELMAFTASLPFDRRLADDDVAGPRAHVRLLARGGLLDAQEASMVLAALDRVAEELADGHFEFEPSDEDIHTALERRVTELAGDAGARLHTGRSRNDQVATDLRLYVRREGSATARA